MSKVLVDRELLERIANKAAFLHDTRKDQDKLAEILAQPAEALIYAPVEPSLEMQNAGWREIAKQGADPEELDVASIYRAMLASYRDTI